MKRSERQPAGAPPRLVAVRPSGLCLSDKEIEDYIFDRFSGDTREVIEQHFLSCASCVERLEAEEDYVAAFRSAARILEAEDRQAIDIAAARRAPAPFLRRFAAWWSRPWGWTPRFALAGAMAVFALLVVLPFQRSGDSYASVSLVTQRGEASLVATVSARQPIRLHMDLTELRALPAYRLDLVDAAGAPVRHATINPQGSSLEWNVDRLAPGQYWVRLADGATGELLREYGLLVARK
jgi:hypothetical protein